MSHPAPHRPAKAGKPALRWKHRFEDRLSAVLLRVTRVLPYRQRIAVLGWVGAYVIGPVAGMPSRIRANLALVAPDMPEREIRHLCRRVPGNMARALAETFAGQDFIDHVKDSPIEGGGMPALEQARDAGQPVVLVTAHLGNYEAARVVLQERGCKIAGIYMPMRNLAFNARYVAAMSRIGSPVFPRNRTGLAGLLKFLRQGGMIGLVADHYMDHGELMDFMGQPARTALSSAEIALKQGALLVPVYGIRQPDGVSFRVRVEPPIAHSDAATMTRALNASVEALVRANMDQWMWSHRRWKKNQPPEKP
ncbi:MAG: lauroyl acyltransferase [Roseinatronobacter sp.]|nr:MAG: lauroyl acyltransferase [Roseinatronobacter sp.]